MLAEQLFVNRAHHLTCDAVAVETCRLLLPLGSRREHEREKYRKTDRHALDTRVRGEASRLHPLINPSIRPMQVRDIIMSH